jgi:putative endonuclease
MTRRGEKDLSPHAGLTILLSMHQYYVYILASLTRRLYIGMTNDLERRIIEHKTKRNDSFTAHYNINRLVYYDTTPYVNIAIEREKELKGWRREKKLALINAHNPAWKDLSAEWYAEYKKASK